jgi:hypothetical protein
MRIDSHVRFKPPVRRDTPMPGSRAPSTLPPPPFSHEAEVTGVEWWLDAHMGVVSSMSILEQLLDGVKLAGASELAADLSELRDALYELYCDAADDRMRAVTTEACPFTKYIKGLYTSADAVLAAFIMVAAAARSKKQIDWAPLEEQVHHLADTSADDAIRAALAPLQIDAKNPTEPLRNLQKDVASTFAAARTLAERLSRLG